MALSSASFVGHWAAGAAFVLAACASAKAPEVPAAVVSAPQPDSGMPPLGEAPPLGIAVQGNCFGLHRQSQDANQDALVVTIPGVTSSAPNRRFVTIRIWSPLSADFPPVRDKQELLLSSTPRDVVVRFSAPRSVQAFEVVLRIDTSDAVLTKEIRRVCPT